MNRGLKLSAAQRLIALVVVVLLLGGVLFLAFRSKLLPAPTPSSPPVVSAPTAAGVAGATAKPVATATPPGTICAGCAGIEVPVEATNPLAGYLIPGTTIDVMFLQSPGQVQYVFQNVQIVSSSVSAGVAGAGSDILIEVQQIQANALTGEITQLKAAPGQIYFAIEPDAVVAAPILTTPTPVPTVAPTPKPTPTPTAKPSTSASPATTPTATP